MNQRTPPEVLQAFQVPGHSDWYTIGYGESRVTLRTQQVRGLNLAWALSELGQLAGETVVVIGGGAAGLTVAAGLARRGADVTVLEKERHLMPLQRNCHKRHLHPHVFDWPEATADNTRADLPLLDWQAGSARSVALSIEDAFEQLKINSATTLEHHCAVSNIELDSPASGHLLYRTGGSTGRRRSVEYTKLIFALGFGLENPFWGGRRASYWADDSLEQHGVIAPGRYLVSGGGDGGLIDVFRLLLPEITQPGLVRLVRSGIPQYDKFLGWVRDVDNQANLAYENGCDGAEARDRAGKVLWELYEAFEPTAYGDSNLDQKLSAQLQENVHVTLVTRDRSPFAITSRPLHRFLFSRLLFHCHERVDVNTSVDLTPDLLTQQGRQVAFRGNQSELFEHALVRHGADRVSCYAAFPALQRALDGWTPCKIGHEQQFARDYFGSPGAAYRGGTGPSQEDYIDELWGRGYLTDTVAERIPLSAFSEIALEIREVHTNERVPTGANAPDELEPAEAVDPSGELPGGDGKRSVSADEPSTPPGRATGAHSAQMANAEAQQLARSRWGITVAGVATLPKAVDVSQPTFIQGQAGAGKTTLVQQLIHAQIEGLSSHRAGRFPIHVKVPPDLEYWGEDMAAALADAALRSVELPNYSPAESRLRRMLQRPEGGVSSESRPVVFLDGVESWKPDVFAEVVYWLSAQEHPFVCCARRFPVEIATLRLGRAPRQLELLGIAPANRVSFIRQQLGQRNVKLLPLPERHLVRRVPFLMLEQARAHHEGSDPSSLLDLYETRIAALLKDTKARDAAACFAKKVLCRDPPHFHFPAASIPGELREVSCQTPLFSGSRTLEFSHLTYGEFLACKALSPQDFEAARRKLRESGDTWHHQLEVLPMGHARSVDQLQACLQEVNASGDGKPRLLALIMRALAYGGSEVKQFLHDNSESLLQTLLSVLASPSGRFGEQERELVQIVLATAPSLKVSIPDGSDYSRLTGDPGAAQWAILLALGNDVSARPPDTSWWDTVFSEARALVASGRTIDAVVEMTKGAQDSVEQAAALAALGESAARSWMLTSRDRFARRHAALTVENMPHGLARLMDSDEVARHRGWEALPGDVKRRAKLRQVFLAMAEKSPWPDQRAAALHELGELQDDTRRNALLRRFRELLKPQKSITGGQQQLFSELLSMFVEETEVQDDLNGFVKTGATWFCTADDAQLLLAAPERQDLHLERLKSPSVTYDDIVATEKVGALHPPVREILRQLLDGRGKPGLIAACIRALRKDGQSRDLLIRCVSYSPALNRADTEKRHPHAERIQLSAARVLADDDDAEVVLRSMLDWENEPEVAYGVLASKRFQATTLAAEIAEHLVLGHWDDGFRGEWNNEIHDAIRVLGEHETGRQVLCAQLEKKVPGPGKPPWDYRRSHAFRALAPHWDNEQLLGYLDDPSAPLRDACVSQLLDKNRREVLTAAQTNTLRARVFVEKSTIARSLLWNHFASAGDADVSTFLLSKSRTDLWALRRAFFAELSDDEDRLEELRGYLQRALKEARCAAILPDLIEALARDPEARQPLRQMLDKGRDAAAIAMRVFMHDTQFREEARERLKVKPWCRQFHWMSEPLERFFGQDEVAKQFLLRELQQPTPAIPHADLLSVVGDYAPARTWALDNAITSDDINLRREARRLCCNEPAVREILEAELNLDPNGHGNLVNEAVYCAQDADWAWPRVANLFSSEDKRTRKTAFMAAMKLRQIPKVLESEDDQPVQLHELEQHPELRRFFAENLPYIGLSEQRRASIRRRSATMDPDAQTREIAARGLRRAELLTALHTTLNMPKPIRPSASEDDTVRDFEGECNWLKLKLVSTLPDDQTWQTAEYYVDDVVDAFGEMLPDKKEGVTLVRLAKDAEELPRDRKIYPIVNVILAWLSAANIEAPRPTTILLACADLHSEELWPALPELRPGEVCLGPVFFGFRLKERVAQDRDVVRP